MEGRTQLASLNTERGRPCSRSCLKRPANMGTRPDRQWASKAIKYPDPCRHAFVPCGKNERICHFRFAHQHYHEPSTPWFPDSERGRIFLSVCWRTPCYLASSAPGSSTSLATSGTDCFYMAGELHARYVKEAFAACCLHCICWDKRDSQFQVNLQDPPPLRC